MRRISYKICGILDVTERRYQRGLYPRRAVVVRPSHTGGEIDAPPVVVRNARRLSPLTASDHTRLMPAKGKNEI